jgi:hypothetical protein
MIQETLRGWALVVKDPDGTERMLVWHYQPKEASSHAKDMLESQQKHSPEKSFRLIDLRVDVKEV